MRRQGAPPSGAVTISQEEKRVPEMQSRGFSLIFKEKDKVKR